ncbi:transcriptional regulator [Clostridia bacterium]|nr:transcriptional regulator [Clostridia bacterium]
MIVGRLKTLRKNKGITQEELAKAIGVLRHSYVYYEKGTRSPTCDILVKICKQLDVSADYLLGLSDVISTYEQSLKLSRQESELIKELRTLGENEQSALFTLFRAIKH